jgi:2-iminobutanoate/2-iminopropanoate deaminase
MDAGTGEIIAPGDMTVQTWKTLENIRAILEGAGSRLEKVVKVTAYIDTERWKEFNEAYKEFFPDDSLPARSIVSRPKGGKQVISMDAIAYI